MWGVLFTTAMMAAAPAEFDVASRLAAANAAAEALDYSKALTLCDELMASGKLTSQNVWKVWALKGEASAIVGNARAAQDAFERALLLFPAFSISADASPKITAPFTRAQAAMKGKRLTLRPKSRLGPGGTVVTVVDVEDDVLRIVSAGALYAATPLGPFERSEMVHGATLTARWKCSALPCHHYLAAHDDYGNELVRAGSATGPLFVEEGDAPPASKNSEAISPATTSVAPTQTSATATAEAATNPPGFFSSPWPYAVAGAAFAGVGAVFAARLAGDARASAVLARTPSNATFAEAKGLEASAAVNHGLMWGAFIAAGAGLVTAAFVW